MDFKKLHEKFKDNDSPSVEGQIRWLQKQGFPQQHIDQAMLELYTDLEMGKIPQAICPISEDPTQHPTQYAQWGEGIVPTFGYMRRDIKNGWELDQVLLSIAKRVRTEEIAAAVKYLEKFEKKLRKKWASQMPWYKRMVGIKPKYIEDEMLEPTE